MNGAPRAHYDIFCDESGHLEHDLLPDMVLGAISAPHEVTSEVNAAIRALKAQHGYNPDWEVKWTGVSPSRQPFYVALVDYFLSHEGLCFRGLVAHGKEQLRHQDWNQRHDDWYYKMYYQMLQPILDPAAAYRIYLDIKDTQGGPKVRKLHEVLSNSIFDFDRQVIERIQIQRSDEIQLLQLADFLIGAVAYANRGLNQNGAKTAVIRRLERGAGVSLLRNTRLVDRKLNLFHWKPRGAW